MKALVIASPIGPLRLRAEDGSLVAVDFSPFAERTDLTHMTTDLADTTKAEADDRVLAATAAQLDAYFAGTLTSFDLPLAPRGTEFQQRVWQALRHVGYGETASYSDVARRLGKTAAASRAIGLANGRNPIPIIIPCHRIIGRDGALTGYAGGIDRKRRLLELERPSLIPDEI